MRAPGAFIVGVIFGLGASLCVGAASIHDAKNKCAREHDVYTCDRVVTYVPVREVRS